MYKDLIKEIDERINDYKLKNLSEWIGDNSNDKLQYEHKIEDLEKLKKNLEDQSSHLNKSISCLWSVIQDLGKRKYRLEDVQIKDMKTLIEFLNSESNMIQNSIDDLNDARVRLARLVGNIDVLISEKDITNYNELKKL